MSNRNWFERVKKPWIGEPETHASVSFGLVRGLLEWR